jgi:acyl dehydratase
MTDAYAENVTAADLAVGDTGPPVVVEDLEREDFVRYAGASGDFNPIHYDEPLADAAGYESVFGQGMLTAGFAAQAVSDWFGLANVRSFGVRFESQVWPGSTVTAVAEVTAISVDGDTATVEADVRATTEDGETVLSGEATAELPAGN